MKKNIDSLNKYMKNAEKEMLKLNHPYVGSEHMILSLLKEKEIIDICDNYDLTYDIFKKELLNVIGVSNIKTINILHTPLLKSIVKDALDNAKENNNCVLTSYHLFLSILECGDGIGVRILISLGIDLEAVYKEMKKKIFLENNILNNYGYDLSDNDTVLIGREKEITQIIQVLLRKDKNNPLLVGDSGVGKTAIVEAIASRIANNEFEKFIDYKIFYLDMSLLVSGCKYRGDFEERLNLVIKEVIENKKMILFIDEIHTIMNAGGSEGAINAVNILKPYLCKDKLKIIGATTKEEYNNYFLKDKALVRRFDVIHINEPSIECTKNILYKIKNKYKDYHNIRISNKNIEDVISLSNKYIIDRKNPDKCIDVLDSVCSCVKTNKKKTINIDDIKNVISRKISRSLEFNKQIMINNIINKVYGQDNVIENIVNIIEKNNDYKSILLIGGIGVGKSISVKEIARELDMNFILINMNEFSNYYSINNIYNGEDSLYSRLNGNSIILFDNIEKCNSNILDIILKIIDEKKIKEKSLYNSIIFLSVTNNISYSIGFNNTISKNYYNNKKVLDIVDYVIYFNDINEDAVNKYLLNNNIKDFDNTLCDYKNYGFRGVKISLNNKNYMK